MYLDGHRSYVWIQRASVAKISCQGGAQKEIAEKLNLSYVTVSRYLGREGFFERLKRRLGLE